jgi:hypothetical protein
MAAEAEELGAPGRAGVEAAPEEEPPESDAVEEVAGSELCAAEGEGDTDAEQLLRTAAPSVTAAASA